MTLDRLFRFVQFEYPWPLGPADGRYLIRDHAGEEAHHVLVVASWPTTVAAGRRRWGRGDAEARREPAETGLTRATLIDTVPVDDEAAGAWLAAAVGERAAATLAEALRWLNHVLRAHRAAAADPEVNDVGPDHALAVRAGYGLGEEVADGGWTAARDLPRDPGGRASRRARRDAALRPQERLAALLSGRDAVLVCEELALRARWDLEHDRPREAALGAHLALEAAVAELPAFAGSRLVGERLPELEARREALATAANEALQGGPSAAAMGAVSEGLDRVEAALRARSAASAY